MKRKVLTIFLMLTLVFSMTTLSVLAAEKTQDGVLAQQTTDTTAYQSTENITATLTVTNQNDTAITNVVLTNLVPDGYYLISGEIKQQTFASVEAGQTVTLATTFAPNPAAPQTGDSENGILLFAVIGIVSLLAAALILRSRKSVKGMMMILVFCFVASAGMLTFGGTVFALTGEPASLTITTEVTVDGTALPVESTVSYEKAVPEYTVTFDSQGHGTAPASIANVQEGATIEEPEALAEEGYTFGGWYKDADCTDEWVFDTDTVMNDTVLYAMWTANTYAVRFDANGGTGSMEDQSFTYDEAQNLTANVFEKTGYVFVGWNTDADATEALYTDEQEVENLTSANGDTLTLYAIWNVAVSFDLNGVSGTAPEPQIVAEGAKATKPADPTVDGYTFKGWYKEPECETEWDFDTDTVTSMVTLYAKWESSISTILEKNPSFPRGTTDYWYNSNGSIVSIVDGNLLFTNSIYYKTFPVTTALTKTGYGYYIYDSEMTVRFVMAGDTITSVSVYDCDQNTVWWAEGTYRNTK